MSLGTSDRQVNGKVSSAQPLAAPTANFILVACSGDGVNPADPSMPQDRPRVGTTVFTQPFRNALYYATFLFARSICRQNGWIAQTGSGSDHGAIASVLAGINEDSGRDFQDLQRFRRTADCAEKALGPNSVAKDAQLAIDLAEFIRTELNRLT